ncbi:hypothetical protein HK102_000719 [Quaeritorhiza haematococci]|nr:hypothetical protein HK102_000719 [Quaeritorhiza haematococci]
MLEPNSNPPNGDQTYHGPRTQYHQNNQVPARYENARPGSKQDVESGTKPLATAKDEEVGYIGALRWIGVLIIFNSSFLDLINPDILPSSLTDRESLLVHLIRNYDWAITLAFIITGRVLTISHRRRLLEAANLNEPSPANTSKNAHRRFLSAWTRFSRSLFIRPFRYALPALLIAVIQERFCNETKDGNTNLASTVNGVKLLRDAGLSWCELGGHGGHVWTLFANLFTRDGTSVARRIGGEIYILTWSFWGSYAVYITFLATSFLGSNRFLLYAGLLFFSWLTLPYNFAIFLGLTIADLAHIGVFSTSHQNQNESHREQYNGSDSVNDLSTIATDHSGDTDTESFPPTVPSNGGGGVRRLATQALLLFCTGFVVLCAPVRNGINDAFGKIQVLHNDDLKIFSMSNCISVLCLVLWLEMTPMAANLFSNGLLRRLGQLSFAIFLTHQFLLRLVLGPLSRHLLTSNPSLPSSTAIFADYVITLLTSIAFAFLWYWLMERTSLAIGKKLWKTLVTMDRAPSTPPRGSRRQDVPSMGALMQAASSNDAWRMLIDYLRSTMGGDTASGGKSGQNGSRNAPKDEHFAPHTPGTHESGPNFGGNLAPLPSMTRPTTTQSAVTDGPASPSSFTRTVLSSVGVTPVHSVDGDKAPNDVDQTYNPFADNITIDSTSDIDADDAISFTSAKSGNDSPSSTFYAGSASGSASTDENATTVINFGHEAGPTSSGMRKRSSSMQSSVPGTETATTATFDTVVPAPIGGSSSPQETQDAPHKPQPTPTAKGSARSRLGFLDGIRGMAALLILTHHYTDNTTKGLFPTLMTDGSPQYFLKNGEFGLALLIAISGRVIILSFLTKMHKWYSSASTPTATASQLKNIYLAFASSIVRRSFRLAAPVFFIALMQQQLCIHGYLDVALEARDYLKIPYLGIPYWCRVDNIWNFYLEMFTFPDAQYLLDLSSSLWSMFVFLWGSYYIFIVSALIAHIPSLSARLCLHIVLILFNAATYNMNLIFTIGILLADLDACGCLKKLQKGRWHIMLSVKLVLATIVVALLATDVVGKAIDFTLYPFIVRDGVMGGTDPEKTRYWPIMLYPSNVLAATAFLAWVECSPTTQWILGNRLFMLIGKYSFGIYSLHMTVIYALVTRIILAFRDMGWPFWTNVSVTYALFVLLSLTFAIVFYNLIDRPIQKIANASFNYLFKPDPRKNDKGKIAETGDTTQDANCPPLTPFHDLRALPSRLMQTLRNSPTTLQKGVRSYAAKWKTRFIRWGQNVSFIIDNMTDQNKDKHEWVRHKAKLCAAASEEEDKTIDPATLCSTEWLFQPFSSGSSSSPTPSNRSSPTASFSSDFTNLEDPNNTEVAYTRLLGAEAAQQAKRTARLLEWYKYGFIMHFVVIVGGSVSWFLFNPIGKWTGDFLTFPTLWRFVWTFTIPYTIITFVSLCYPRIPPKPKKGLDENRVVIDDIRPVVRPVLRHFYILTVTKGTNQEAVRHSYNQMKPFERLHPSIKVLVLSDEPWTFPDLQNVVVPKAYTTDEGKGKYKARALDFFRKHMKLTRYDWTLHMDEESTIDAESLRRCFEFIRYDTADWGQGVILYNNTKDNLYWKNPFYAIADAIRVGDDLARFHLQYSLFRRPIFGAHGSFLMLNGQIENIVTWDFATLAEDFEFSHKAWEIGFTCGPIHGFVREQSPQNIRDFMKQRRRWYMGIRELKGMYGLPQLALVLWTIGVYGLVGTLVNIPFSIWVDGAPTPLWIAIAGTFNFACLYWLYLFGILFQEVDNGTPIWLMLLRVVISILLQPFVTIAEAASVIWAIKSEDKGKFEVIKK